MRKTLIAANWKMNKTVKESVSLAKELKKLDKLLSPKDSKGLVNSKNSQKDMVVCPAFTALHAVKNELKGSKIKLGAQNMYPEEKGAFTGEISPLMLKELCTYVIIGHSERRAYFKESNNLINKKIKKALNHDLRPIVCVGENLAQRILRRTRVVIKNHIEGALKDLKKAEVLKLVIAYEPVWAIGTGKTATPEHAEEVHVYIRQLISEMYGEKTAKKIRILYGGSVKSKNAKALLSKENIDGALVGTASLNAKEFARILK